MPVKTILKICCLLMMWIQVIKGLACYVCNDAKSEKDCNWNTETCAINQGSCFTEIRNFGKEIRLKKSCYQKQACNNLQQQSESHACPRVCALCCEGDLCNVRPPQACSCGLTTRSPPRTRPNRRPNIRRTSRKPTSARARPRTTSNVYRRSTTTSAATTSVPPPQPTTTTTTTTTTAAMTTTTEPTEVGVTERKFNTNTSAASSHTSASTKLSIESSTINLLEANPLTLRSSQAKQVTSPSTNIPTLVSTSPNSTSTLHVSNTTFMPVSYENSNSTRTSLSRITEQMQQTTAIHAGDIKLGAGDQNASTTSVASMVLTSPTLCGEIAFVQTPHTNKKIISCQNSMENKTVCASNFGMGEPELFNLFTYNQSTNATEYHQCQTQPTNVSIPTTYERSIPILCIRNSNQSNIRQLRRQKLLISPNHQSDNATYSVECRLVNVKQNKQFASSQNEEAESDTSPFISDTIERMEKFCDQPFFGIQCSVILKSATTTETTPALQVASGNPSWMIPVIVAAVVVVVILLIVLILVSLRKTGFYRVRKKVKADDKAKE